MCFVGREMTRLANIRTKLVLLAGISSRQSMLYRLQYYSDIMMK